MQKGNTLIFLLIGVLIIAVAGGTYYLGTKKSSTLQDTVSRQNPVIIPSIPPQQNNKPTPDTNPQNDETANWNTYKASSYSIEYPVNATVQGGADAISFTLWGPTQKADTEFYDALVLRFDVWPLNNRSLKQIMEDDSKKSGDVLENPQSISIVGISGYFYKARGLGDHRYIYLPKGSDEYILIIDSTNDPSNQGFHKLVARMLSTLKVY